MSHVDSKEEEAKRILAKVNSNDSKESNNSKNKGKTWTDKDDNGNEVEKNDRDTPDSEW